MVELLVALAIIALLAAIAIPQYSKFMARVRRAEVYLVLNGVHKAQKSYFALHDHYMHVCDFLALGNTCSAGASPVDQNQMALGMAEFNLGYAAHGYTTMWYYEQSNVLNGDPNKPLNYQLDIINDLIPDNGVWDWMIIGDRNQSYSYGCANVLNEKDGEPFIAVNDLTGTTC